MFQPMTDHRKNAEGLYAEVRPDFRHVTNWIFDLDNTLYCADSGIFAQIEARMTIYIMDFLGLSRDQALARQKELYFRYGTTLNGLMIENDCRAEDYLNFVHDIDLSGLASDTRLSAALAGLPGRRFVLTNGCGDHADRILERLGVECLFEQVWDIRALNFRPKPDASAYIDVIRAAGINARQAAMFDDIPNNLVPARTLGMTTIWMRDGGSWTSQCQELKADLHYIDYQTDNLTQFLLNVRTGS